MIGLLVFFGSKDEFEACVDVYLDWVDDSDEWIVIFVNWVGSSVGWIDEFSDTPVSWNVSFKLSDSSEVLAMIF